MEIALEEKNELESFAISEKWISAVQIYSLCCRYVMTLQCDLETNSEVFRLDFSKT